MKASSIADAVAERSADRRDHDGDIEIKSSLRSEKARYQHKAFGGNHQTEKGGGF
jgi:hypothetical protein